MDVEVARLELINCFLTMLSDEAFSSPIFERMIKLQLHDNNISTLRRATFRPLKRLEYLSINNNEIKEAEQFLLQDTAVNLENLEFEQAISDAEVLRNITGGSTRYYNVKELALRYNHITIIDSRLFAGIIRLENLYLQYSNIETVDANTFEWMDSIRQIFINDNNISTLPKGLFDSVISHKNSLILSIHNNPWNCDCNLKWMQDMIIRHPGVVQNIPICSSPEANRGKTFTDADFCNQRTTKETSVDDTTHSSVTSTTTPGPTMSVNCETIFNHLYSANYSPRMFSSNNIEISLRLHNFSVTELVNGSTLLNVSDSNDIFFIWFDNKVRLNTSSLNNSVQCARVNGHYILPIEPRKSYTICSLDNLSFSPLNCLGMSISIRSEDGLSADDNIDMDVIISVFVISLLTVCFLSAILMFIIVRRYPVMLRGSKRIVIVKRGTPNVMVLPRGLSSDTVESANRNTIPTISQNLKESGYTVLLPPTRDLPRKNSRSSASSDDMSYISGIEPTLSQLNSWRLKKFRYVNRETEPPPLPPHPHPNTAQPLSIVEDKDEDESDSCTV
ncbi:leucine-rich repeat transmembrane protein FLRT1 [Harpegnathos saltator]|uniref:Leucine-rich repeat-containing protein 15 n=1 Tax=Harpegnathos saltator TaxID=610380 RepID=E2BNY9_HARSA|nr:leucine-rich repeat transmembrane protein FLRT1 [Harpegnathos saltator]EFN82581.1 Leucine-rich repeat-containing protein 15 [Harpegnathos saltator]